MKNGAKESEWNPFILLFLCRIIAPGGLFSPRLPRCLKKQPSVKPRYFTPKDILTSLVGQPFGSHLGDQQFASWGCTNLQWNPFLLLALSCYIGDPDMIRSPALLPFSGCFTRLHADNMKSWLDRTSHASPVQFHYPLLAGPPSPRKTQWSVRAPIKLLWGGGALWRPCNFTPTYSLTQPSGSTVCLLSTGSAVHVWECTNLQWKWFLLLALSCYTSNTLS